MTADARRLIDKLIPYRNVLRDAGVGVIEYTEQLTYLLFLKMARGRATPKLAPQVIVPDEFSWQRLLDADGPELETVYSQILAGLASQPGTLGTIFHKSQNRVQDPALLKKLVVDLIGQENWSAGDTNFTGDVYEELLSKSASDQGSGAGQYFTPRELIKAIVDVVQPTPKDAVVDPACGMGGFLLFAHEYAARDAARLTLPERDHPRGSFAHGLDISDGTARLAAMNLMVHGIGTPDGDLPIKVRDALIADPGKRWPSVLTNPPFGKKSSITMIGADGREARDDAGIERQDFVVTTANKQMNFLQQIMTILDIDGRAAVVMPDNVLFEGGVGETLRKRLLRDFDFHTMIRLPIGIRYATGVKVNVLLFDKKPASETPWTSKLWVYDFRTNQHFTLKHKPLRRADLDEFVDVCKADNRDAREDGGEESRWRSFTYDELLVRDQVNLDVIWLRDDSLGDLDNLPAPESIAREVVEDLTAALTEFEAVAAALEAGETT